MPEEPFAVRTNMAIANISIYPSLYHAIMEIKKQYSKPRSIAFFLCYRNKEIQVEPEVYSKKEKFFSNKEIRKVAKKAKGDIEDYISVHGTENTWGKGLRCAFSLGENTDNYVSDMIYLDSVKDKFTIKNIAEEIEKKALIDVWRSDEELEELNPDKPAIIISDGIRKLEIED